MRIKTQGPDGQTIDLPIPDTAIPIVSDAGPNPGAQAADIQAIKDAYMHEDSQALIKQRGAYDGWLAEAGRDRDLGMSSDKWPPKPQQGMAHTVNVAVQTNGTAWLWVTTAPLGTACPDLPPVTPTQPPPGTVQVGNHNFGLYWAQGPLDNPPDDVFSGKTVQATSLDGVSGTWMFVGHPMSSPIYGRKGWYLKVG